LAQVLKILSIFASSSCCVKMTVDYNIGHAVAHGTFAVLSAVAGAVTYLTHDHAAPVQVPLPPMPPKKAWQKPVAQGDGHNANTADLMKPLVALFILLLAMAMLLLMIFLKKKPEAPQHPSTKLTAAVAAKKDKLEVASTPNSFIVGDTLHIFDDKNKVGETVKIKTITHADATKKIGASITLAGPVQSSYTVGATVKSQATTTLTAAVTAKTDKLEVASAHDFTVGDTIHIKDLKNKVGEKDSIKAITYDDAKKKFNLVLAAPLKSGYTIGATVQAQEAYTKLQASRSIEFTGSTKKAADAKKKTTGSHKCDSCHKCAVM